MDPAKRSGKRRTVVIVALFSLTILGCAAAIQMPAAGAGGLLHPFRRRVSITPHAGCESTIFAVAEVSLAGWR